MNKHQRIGVKSNAHAGKDFELKIQNYFKSIKGIDLQAGFPLEVGVNKIKKTHNFDFGSSKNHLIVECKSHKWTESGKIPVAKLTAWNEVMLYFIASPPYFEKILIVLKDYNAKRKTTLGEYYLNIYGHFIPQNIQIWEFDEDKNEMKTIYKNEKTV